MLLDSASELVAQQYSTDNLNELVQAAREGSEEAFEQMIRMYHRDVRVFVLRFLGSATEADEIAQEVFIQVFKSISSFNGASTLKTWILGIARNRVLTHLKKEIAWKKKHQSNLLDEISEFCFTASTDNIVDDDQWEKDLTLLQYCLEKLRPEHTDVVQRFYFEKQSAEDIGEQVGKKSGAIRMLLMRIRKSLEKCIRKNRNQGTKP